MDNVRVQVRAQVEQSHAGEGEKACIENESGVLHCCGELPRRGCLQRPAFKT